jgi:hypothetical protein
VAKRAVVIYVTGEKGVETEAILRRCSGGALRAVFLRDPDAPATAEHWGTKGYFKVELCCHSRSRVSDFVTRTYRLPSTGAFVTIRPARVAATSGGCQVGYMDLTGCHQYQLNRVLKLHNVKSVAPTLRHEHDEETRALVRGVSAGAEPGVRAHDVQRRGRGVDEGHAQARAARGRVRRAERGARHPAGVQRWGPCTSQIQLTTHSSKAAW